MYNLRWCHFIISDFLFPIIVSEVIGFQTSIQNQYNLIALVVYM